MGRRNKQKVKGIYFGGGYFSQRSNQGMQLKQILEKKRPQKNNHKNAETLFHDLNIPYPRTRSSSQLPVLLQRLQQTGYSVIALTHTVYGRAQLDRDFANVAVPFPPNHQEDGKKKQSTNLSLKRKREDDTNVDHNNAQTNTLGLTILKRLNIILEDISDLSHYTTVSSNTMSSSNSSSNASQNDNSISSLLQSYDLISFTPRTEAIFSALSNSISTPMDILTIDYSYQTSNRLPYILRHSDISNFTQRGIALELNYGPAIVDPSKRKLWIMAARELKIAHQLINKKAHYESQGNNRKVKDMWIGRPKLLLSSGLRTLNGVDLSAMALRSPNDIMNVCQVVLGWDNQLVEKDVMRRNAAYVVKRGRMKRTGRRFGFEDGMLSNHPSSSVDVVLDGELKDHLPLAGESFVTGVSQERKTVNENELAEGDDEDGFLHF